MKVRQEDVELIKIREWVINHSDLPFLHLANERQCNPVYGSMLRRMGVRKGISDIFIPRATKDFHGTFIELKVGSNKPTNEQQQFLDDMKNEGYAALCLWGSEAAIAFIKELYDVSDLKTP